MATEIKMKAALQQYIDGFNKKDANMLISLFADDAKIEDPVGGGKIIEGREAIRFFYQRAVTMVDRLELAAPIRSSHSNCAAMAFTIFMTIKDKPMQINAIDVMVFNKAGKIIEMKAYHGPSDLTVG